MKDSCKNDILKTRIISSILFFLFLGLTIFSLFKFSGDTKSIWFVFFIVSVCFTFSLFILLIKAFLCKVKETIVENYHIVICETLFGSKIYVNGVFKGRACYFRGKGHVTIVPATIKMEDGCVITVTPKAFSQYSITVSKDANISIV